MIDDVNKNKKLYSLYVTLYTRLIILDNFRVYTIYAELDKI